jgi:hypothetical protein
MFYASVQEKLGDIPKHLDLQHCSVPSRILAIYIVASVQSPFNNLGCSNVYRYNDGVVGGISLQIQRPCCARGHVVIIKLQLDPRVYCKVRLGLQLFDNNLDKKVLGLRF